MAHDRGGTKKGACPTLPQGISTTCCPFRRASAQQVHYVRLLKPRDQDPFVTRSQVLNAADGLHPSSAGYAEWYRELVAQGGLNGLTQ